MIEMSRKSKEMLLKKLKKNFDNDRYKRTVKIANEIIKSYPPKK